MGNNTTIAGVLAGLITFLSAADLVLGFADRAREHGELRRRFITIEACMVDSANEDTLRKCQRDRLAIESDEPPKMHALDILCHNELLIADGYDPADEDQAFEFREIGWYKKLTADVFRWSAAKFPRSAERPVAI